METIDSVKLGRYKFLQLKVKLKFIELVNLKLYRKEY